MGRLILVAVLSSFLLSACGGVIDRDPSGLYDPDSNTITRHEHP